MRVARLLLLAAVAATSSALSAQESPSSSYALALRTRYMPLELVRDGTVRMPRALGRKVTVHRQNVPLQQVLLDIATQAGLGLSYGEDLARANTVVSMDADNKTAAEALAAAVRGTDWAVLVTPSGQVAVVPSGEQQLGVVIGRVTDRASGLGIASSVLTIEGTRLGATADDSGRYRITNVPPGSYTLGVRRIGYVRGTQPISVIADQTTTADFALDQSASTLDQIVVTGVPGAVSKRTLGNSITTIDAAALTERATNANLTELLQAKAPGLTILPGGGSPGTGASLRIRGAGSLVANTSPVIYVDGVRIYTGSQGNFWNSWRSQRSGENAYGAGQDGMALDMLKPEDIESIEMIKGPAAATLYGAEAANGVIQIITKKGTRGEQSLRWTASGEVGATDWAVDRVTNYTTCTPALTALRFGDGTPQFPGCQGVAPNTILNSTSLDLPGALRTGTVNSLGVSLRGGGQNHSFFAAVDRDEEEGVFLNSMNARTTARANFSIFPRENLDLAVNVGYSHTHTQFPINDDGFGLIQAAMLYRPGFQVNQAQPGWRDGFFGGGPEAIYLWDNHLRANRMTLGATANYQPFSWLKNRLTIGVDQTSRIADKFLPPNSIWGGVRGQAERGAPENSLYTLDYAGTVLTSLPNDLTSSFSFGAQYTANHYRNTIARGTGFAVGSTRQVALAAATESFTEITDQKSLGLYVQEQVGWRDRLYLTGAVRVDNNSVFGDDIKQLYYPKLSAAYVISDEAFFAGRFSWIDQLKLRAAWGQAGNAPVPFAGDRSFTSGPTVDENGNRVPALRTFAYGNPEIKPERGSEIELGFDASLLGSRVGLELTYYNKTTKDALMQVPVPASSGFIGFRLVNLGEINNKGVEISLNATPVDIPRLTWDTRLGFSSNTNKLISFGDDRDPIMLSLYGTVQRHQEGFPLGGYWGQFPRRNEDGSLARNGTGGLIPDTVFIGPSTPTREISFSNTFTILNNLRLYALIDYKGGHYLYNVKDNFRCWGQPVASTWNTNPAQNIPGQCWDVNDPNASEEFKEIRQQDPSINNGIFIQRADFIKLRDISLSYVLPTAWTRRFGSEQATITLAAHNLGFLWKPDYTGPDPEVNFTGVNDPGGQFAFIRVDSWTAPMTRRLTASLTLGF